MINLNISLPHVPESVLLSVWVSLDAGSVPLSRYGPTFTGTVLCTDTSVICISLDIDKDAREYKVKFEFGGDASFESALSTTDLETRENRANSRSSYNALWINLAIEYVHHESLVRFWVNNEKVGELPTSVQTLEYADFFLGTEGGDGIPVLVDEIRVIRGILEEGELATAISDPILEKYLGQSRVVAWYDFNEESSSNSIRDRGNLQGDTNLPNPVVRSRSRSEGFLYSILHHTSTRREKRDEEREEKGVVTGKTPPLILHSEL